MSPDEPILVRDCDSKADGQYLAMLDHVRGPSAFLNWQRGSNAGAVDIAAVFFQSFHMTQLEAGVLQ